MFNNFLQGEDFFGDPFADEDGFAKRSIFETNNNMNGGFCQSIDDDPLFDNLGGPGSSAVTSQQQMLIMDDFNKIHNNFAGYTFSQISSTYEQQQQPINLNNANQQQSQNDQRQSKSKLYEYHEKNNKSKSQNKNNDDLLDSDILNNSNDDLNSPKDQNNQHVFAKGQNSNMIMDLQPTGNNNFLYKQQDGNLPSYQSNINLNNIIMNSDNLQQSITSTMTIYNSAVFDDASILRILDRTTISEDSSIFVYQDSEILGNHKKQQQQSSIKQNIDLEQNFKFESEDVKLILSNISTKFKEKLQKSRMHNNSTHSQTQFVAVSLDEIKQFEILTTSAIEKIRQIQGIGKQIIDHSKLRNLQFKNQRQNLKIHIHKEIHKFKDLCKRQYKQAEHQRFKNQISEFEWSQKIQSLEERLEKQADEINRLANKNEQLKYEKSHLITKNDQKLTDFDKILCMILNTMNENQENDKKTKVNKSFCVGSNDHSMLLQTKINKKAKLMKHQQDLQQSVDEKENESFLSNKNSANQYQQNNTIKKQLDQLRKVMLDYKMTNQQLKRDFQLQQEVGSYQDSISIQNLLSNFNNNNHNNGIQRDSLIQQSQFIPEDSQASMNKAFIQQEEDSSQDEDPLNQAAFFGNQEEEEQSIDYNFEEGHILVVMDGMQKQGNGQSEEGLKIMDDLQYLDDKIMPGDLRVKNQKERELTDTQKIIQEQKRDQVLYQRKENKVGQHFLNSSIENSIEDDLNILKNLDNDSGQINLKKELQFFNDFSGIDQNDSSLFMKNGQNGDLYGGSGKLIFIENDLNSRNNNEILYSGGSSLLSLNQAFNISQKGKLSRRGIMTIKVMEREIKIPMLNLDKIMEAREPFKDNIPFTDSSSEMTESQQNSQFQNQNIYSQTNDPNSFNNESIKIFKDQIDKTMSSIQQQDLDKAIYINQSKLLQSNSISSASNQKQQQICGNLLDSFKEELNQMDNQRSGQKDKIFIQEFLMSSDQKNNNKIKDDTLDLDDISMHEEEQKNDKSRIKNDEDDKTIDLSHNVSRFKRSQSDNNLICNDIDLEENLDKDSQQNDKKQGHLNIQTKQKQQIILNFKKIKTPQGSQNFLKFKLPSQSDVSENPQQTQNKRQQLGQFQQKNRSRSGHSRSKLQQDNESQDSSQVVKLQGKDIVKALKNLKIKHQNKSNMTHGEDDNGQVIQLQNQTIVNAGDLTNINHSMMSDQNQTLPLKKKPGNFKVLINTNHKRREQVLLMGQQKSEQSDQNVQSESSTSQLMQNYFSAAAVIQGNPQSQKLSLQQDSFKPKPFKNISVLGLKKASFNAQLEQIKESDPQFENTQGKHSYKQQDNNVNNSMMQQMKEYQESCDLSQNTHQKSKLIVQKNLVDTTQEEDNICLSPNRNQRTSQSCTPQKKSMIIVSKQYIKANSKVSFIKNLQPVEQQQQHDNTSQQPITTIKKISVAKRILNKQGINVNLQNLSVLNASVDQSQIHVPRFQNPNESHIVFANPDNSMMVHEMAHPVVRLQGSKIIRMKKDKILGIQNESMNNNGSQSNLNNLVGASKNLQNLVLQNPAVNSNNSAQFSAKLNRQIIKTVKTQQKHLNDQQTISNYSSNPTPIQPQPEFSSNDQTRGPQQKGRREMIMVRMSNNNSGQGKQL